MHNLSRIILARPKTVPLRMAQNAVFFCLRHKNLQLSGNHDIATTNKCKVNLYNALRRVGKASL